MVLETIDNPVITLQGITDHVEPEKPRKIDQDFFDNVLTESRWSDWLAYVKDCGTSDDEDTQDTFLGDAATIAIVSPRQFEKIEVNEEQWKRAKKRIEDLRHAGDWEKFCALTLNAMTVFKDHASELKVNEVTDYRGVRTSLIAKIVSTDPFAESADFSSNAVLLLPDKRDSFIGPGNFVELAKRVLEDEAYLLFERYLYAAKICHSIDASSEFGEDIWDVLALAIKQSPDYVGSLDMAKYLKLLVAKEVKVTDKGFEVIMPEEPIKDLSDNKTPQPEERTF